MTERHRRPFRLTAAALLVLLALPGGTSAMNCKALIDYDFASPFSARVVVGEARYRVKSGSDESYANAYFDSGAELSLPSNLTIGELDENDEFYPAISASIIDYTTSDCKILNFKFTVYNSNSLCQQFSTASSNSWSVWTCPFIGSDDYVFATELLTTTGSLDAGDYYYKIEVDYWDSGSSSWVTSKSDTGCFHVAEGC